MIARVAYTEERASARWSKFLLRGFRPACRASLVLVLARPPATALRLLARRLIDRPEGVLRLGRCGLDHAIGVGFAILRLHVGRGRPGRTVRFDGAASAPSAAAAAPF